MKIPMSLLRTAGYCCGVLLLASQLAGCGGGGSAAQAKETKADAVTAVPVEVASVSRGQITASYSGTATLTPDHDAQVAAKTSGVLKKLYVEEGMSVKEGQLLAELEDATQRSQLAQAEAQMRKSDATFAYAQQSIAKQLIPKRDFDQAKFDMENLRAAYESARLQLAYTRILAPIGGVIAERSVKLGNLIQTNQSLFRIVGMNPLQTVLNVPERQLGILKAGQPVQLEADALPGKKFSGNILRIAPVVDAASGTFRVTCEFHDKTSELKPGMFGRIDIIYDQRADALTIPRSALIEEDGETAVFVVDKATPESRRTRKQKPATPTPTPKRPIRSNPPRQDSSRIANSSKSATATATRWKFAPGWTKARGSSRSVAMPYATALLCRCSTATRTRFSPPRRCWSQRVNIVEAATRRRVTVGMVTLTFVLFGLIALSGLKVNLLPDLSYPTLTVRTEYEGAAPLEIENLISQPVEEAIGVVKNLRKIHSVSRTGQSDVMLEFAWGTNMDQASLDVRDKLDILQLPLDAKKPVLLRFNPSTDPIMRLVAVGQRCARRERRRNSSSCAALPTTN